MNRIQTLESLDDAITGMQRLLQRPGYRQHFLAALGVPVSPGVLRAVRMVHRLTQPEPGVNDVAAALAVDRSTASRLVDAAVEAGYLTREPGSTDLRRVALGLTPQGKELLARADVVRRQLLAEVTDDWSKEELRTLVDLLGRLSSDLDRYEQP